jgi:hypothetical protein
MPRRGEPRVRVATRSAIGLFSVWGSGPSDIWAVGEQGTILHWP